jgi:isopenicillin N synthase-like dioxygenase
MSLNLPETYFDKMVTHPGGISRLLYYPPQVLSKEKVDENEIGLGAHTDYECFTLLLSDSNPGLEVLSTSTGPGDTPKWITAPANPDNLTVNIGDFMMRWTNGVYRSTIHRVVNRHPELPRYSVPFFFSINYDETVETLPSCVTKENPARYPPLAAGAYVQERLRATVKEDGEGSGKY